MAKEEMNIVAIELGSSKVIGVAGVKKFDGKIEVTAHVQQESATFIRKGIIYNADLAVKCIQNIIGKLKESLHKNITQVYVSYSGQGIHSVHNEVHRLFENEHKIVKEDIDGICEENINHEYEGQSILDAIPQEFTVGTQKLMEPIGVLSSTVTGRYLNIEAKAKLLNNL